MSDFNYMYGEKRNRGRPLAASESQIETELALHEEGRSRRFIAERTGLGERTVRTIIEQKQGKNRTSIKRKFERKQLFNKLRAAEYGRKIKDCNDYLPRRINEHQKTTDELIKAAKGLGKQ